MTLEEQLTDTRLPTQVGRALDELDIVSIAAHSPQAKGRVERLWGTFQDRLVTELRLAGANDREAAKRVLAACLPKFCGVPGPNGAGKTNEDPAEIRTRATFGSRLEYRARA